MKTFYGFGFSNEIICCSSVLYCWMNMSGVCTVVQAKQAAICDM